MFQDQIRLNVHQLLQASSDINLKKAVAETKSLRFSDSRLTCNYKTEDILLERKQNSRMDGGDVSKTKEFFSPSLLTNINDCADGDLLWSARLIERRRPILQVAPVDFASFSASFLDKL